MKMHKCKMLQKCLDLVVDQFMSCKTSKAEPKLRKHHWQGVLYVLTAFAVRKEPNRPAAAAAVKDVTQRRNFQKPQMVPASHSFYSSAPIRGMFVVKSLVISFTVTRAREEEQYAGKARFVGPSD